MSAFSRTDIAAAEVGPSGVKDEDNSKLTVNIPSDETVGKCNTCVLAIYYVPISSNTSRLFGCSYPLLKRNDPKIKNAFRVIFIVIRMDVYWSYFCVILL